MLLIEKSNWPLKNVIESTFLIDEKSPDANKLKIKKFGHHFVRLCLFWNRKVIFNDKALNIL